MMTVTKRIVMMRDVVTIMMIDDESDDDWTWSRQGTHDFSSFRSSGCHALSPVRWSHWCQIRDDEHERRTLITITPTPQERRWWEVNEEGRNDGDWVQLMMGANFGNKEVGGGSVIIFAIVVITTPKRLLRGGTICEEGSWRTMNEWRRDYGQ